MSCLIIAEAGVNHNGDLEMAKRLIDAAAEAGADFVKFQTFKAEKLVTSTAKQADYQKANTGKDESQLAMIKRLELDVDAHQTLIEHCQKRGVAFLSTAFDLDSIDLLDQLGLPLFKVPSGELTNLPYLRALAAKGKPLVLSTGMATLGEVEAALEVALEAGHRREDVTILHCTTEYPTPPEEVNLKAMNTLGSALGTKIGYSDHTRGIEVPIAAAALGAQVIEKHFTLDRNLPGPDHKASLEPDELKAMVQGIRLVETALGDGIKRLTPSEAKNRPIARKSLVAALPIKQGEVFTTENLTAKRPGTGLSPMEWDRILGTKARRDYQPDELIEP